MTARQEQQAVTVARRLGERERAILRALYDYELLLTYQLQVLFFSSARRCQDVLKELAQLKLIERDIPTQAVGIGRAQPHWTLTEDGIHVVAVLKRIPRSNIDHMPRETFFETDKQFDHLLGVNRFFVSLVEASKLHPSHGLEKWVPEKYVRTASSWIRHDGFGRYQHQGGACDFYFEYDRGTEWHDQLVKKLRGYVLMAIKWTGEQDPKQFPNLAVLVPTEKREAAFDKAVKSATESLDVKEATAASLPFFITSEERLREDGILGKVWRQFSPPPSDRPLAPALLAERLSLVHLPARKVGPFDLDNCLGKKWTDSGSKAKTRRLPQPPIFPSGVAPEPLFEEDGA